MTGWARCRLPRTGCAGGSNRQGLLGAFNKPVASGEEATRRILKHGMTALKTCVRSENGEDDAVCGSRGRGLAEVHQAGLGLARGLPSVVGSFGTHSRYEYISDIRCSWRHTYEMLLCGLSVSCWGIEGWLEIGVPGAETLSIRGEALIRPIGVTQHQLDRKSSKCRE